MSPAAKIPGALVSRYSLTVTPRSTARPAFSASVSRGRTPTPTTTRSAVDRAAALQRHSRASIAVAVSSRWKITPCSSCRLRTKSPICGAQHALHRPLVGRHDVDLDAARAQRRRHLETDEARAHHDRAPRRRRLRDDGAAIGERSQRMHVRQVHARQRQSHRLGAGCEQQPVVVELAAVADRDLARTCVDRGDARSSAASRCLARCSSCPRATGPIPPAHCRPGNPWTGSAGRPVARRRRSA